MIEPSQDLSAFLRCLSSTGLPFAFSSLAGVLVAVSIATLERSNLRRLLPLVLGCHLTPLLVAPVLFANVLTTYVESRPHWISWSQSNQFLAFCGFVFHSFLAYLVLGQVFMWAHKVNHARRLTFNNSRKFVVSAIYALELGPPLVFTFAMVFVFQESMISVPLFTRTQTVLSLAQSIMQNSSSLLYSWIVAVSLIFATAIFLILSYKVPKLAAQWTLVLLARRAHTDSSVQKPGLVRATIKGSTLVASLIICISVVVHVSAFVVVIMRLSTLSKGAKLSETGPAWESLATPALKSGAIVFVVWLVVTLLLTKRASPPAFRPLRSLALAPPALIGTMGLLLVIGPISQIVVAYALLFAYAYLLLRFLISDVELAADRVLLHNARVLKFQSSRRFIVVLLSAVGGVMVQALFAFYFLWIEDGVQVTVLTGGSNLANLVRGLRQDKLIPATYYGVMAMFLAWLIVTTGVFLMTRYRYGFLVNRLRKLLPTTVLVLAAVLALTTNIMAQSTAKKSSAAVTSPCVYKAIVIPARGEYNIIKAGCGIIRFDEVTLDGTVGSLNINAPQTAIEIGKLSLLRPGATLYINGTIGQPILELSIRSIALPILAPIDPPQIEFRNAEIGRLTVNGLNLDTANTALSPSRPMANLVIGDSSSAEIVEVHGLISPELIVRLAGKGKDSIHFESVQTASLKVVALSNQASGANIEGMVRLEGRAGQQPSIVLENLRARNIRMVIEGDSGGDISLGNIQMEPQANAAFQLEISKGIVNVHVEDVTLGGRLQFQASASEALYNVTMYGLAASGRILKSPVNVIIRVRNLSRLTLKRLEVEGLDLCGSSVRDSGSEDFELQDISVTGEVAVPSKFIELLSPQGSSAIGRLRFLKILQEHGRFCDSREIIGTYALYSRKKTEMLSLHPFTGRVLDWMTGFGVEMMKPLITFLFLLFLYLLLRTLLLFWDNKLASPRAVRSILGEALLGGFFVPVIRRKHHARIQGSLDNLRVVFGWFVFIQVTLCSIYLSQTTLQ